MLRLFAIGLLALGVMSGTSVQSNFECMESYKRHLEKLRSKEVSPERRAALHRWALRVYDACETGDLENAKGLFERLERQNN